MQTAMMRAVSGRDSHPPQMKQNSVSHEAGHCSRSSLLAAGAVQWLITTCGVPSSRVVVAEYPTCIWYDVGGYGMVVDIDHHPDLGGGTSNILWVHLPFLHAHMKHWPCRSQHWPSGTAVLIWRLRRPNLDRDRHETGARDLTVNKIRWPSKFWTFDRGRQELSRTGAYQFTYGHLSMCTHCVDCLTYKYPLSSILC